MKIHLLLTCLLSCVSFIHSAKILAILPFPGKSHYIFESSIVKALAQRGHQVVEYSPFPPKKPIPNLTHVKVYTFYEEMFANWDFKEMIKHSDSMDNFFGLAWLHIWNFMLPICDEILKSDSIKNLLNSNDHYDLVLTTATFGQESMLVFGHKFKAPTITLQAFRHSTFLNRDAGNDLMIASIPDSMSFAFTDKMTFLERFRNFCSSFSTLFLYYFWYLPSQESVVKKYYNSPDLPSLSEMTANVSLTLINTHPAVSYPQPFTPNTVPIGGITISPERIPLPQDIKKFMDDAKEGVIYFSFGTVVSTHTMPPETLQLFVNVFKKLPQKVLWKIEADTLPGLSKNVKLVKWVPQPGVLGHPNCAAFITHGGVFSQLEAYHAGVPVVGIPFFADQFFNIKFNEEQGIGVKVDFNTLSVESLLSALTKVLKEPKYKENAARISRVFRDVPMSAADTAVFWTEYILRHAGAPHLRPAASSLPLYQLMLLDVAVVVLAACVIIIALPLFVIKKVISLLCGGKKKVIGEKKYK
ncbi:UDP-glycosyltransferase UGT5-like [Macrosteles quadrilineatus]|uniref:UDP-glycosyltransferase UGT5-like n=1 Tax=Macrosteles quadrilineatus TaxID=74068 RepID=UPI0023E19537|nr:UDP-glycosyltransferase UGT5-like [Macrosteles quadrilineatus]XP_054282475.1 UDP-glycosyltransferase UGT5-like [Macrosteles quadrilineatus]XP_054282476.1 UDP-glycosyltransferase UGT5-like [Macrosteles quadrilineatus]